MKKIRHDLWSGRTALAVCGSVVLMAGAAQATLLVQEGFNYPLVSPLDLTQTGGVGFAAGSYWSTNNANGSIVPGLSYPGLATSGSNALKKASYGRVGHPGGRSLSPGFSGSTFYMSLVINTAGQNEARIGVEMNGGNGPCFGWATGGWGLFSGGNGYGGISNTGGAYKVWCGVPSTADSAAHLVVYKFDYTANAIKLYADPFLALGEPALPSATLVTGGAWTVNFSGSQSWSSLSFFSESGN